MGYTRSPFHLSSALLSPSPLLLVFLFTNSLSSLIFSVLEQTSETYLGTIDMDYLLVYFIYHCGRWFSPLLVYSWWPPAQSTQCKLICFCFCFLFCLSTLILIFCFRESILFILVSSQRCLPTETRYAHPRSSPFLYFFCFYLYSCFLSYCFYTSDVVCRAMLCFQTIWFDTLLTSSSI